MDAEENLALLPVTNKVSKMYLVIAFKDNEHLIIQKEYGSAFIWP